MMLYDYTWSFVIVLYALIVAIAAFLAVILVRLALAGTRALNAYTERTKIETALMLALDDDDDENAAS